MAMQSPLASVLVLACAVASALARCDPTVIKKIKAMHKDDNKFSSVIDQLPGTYEVVSIYMGEKKGTPQEHCLKLTIANENSNTLIRFGGAKNFAYPLTFRDGKLVYSGTNKLEKQQNQEKNKEGKAEKKTGKKKDKKEKKRDKEGAGQMGEEDEYTVTISYYIVDHSPEAVSFYTCGDMEKEPDLAFTAVLEAHGSDGEKQAKQATEKLKEIGLTELSTVPLCKDVKKKGKKAANGGGKASEGKKGGKPKTGAKSKEGKANEKDSQKP